ncbi:hypothetical protein [Pseudoalteromonas aurantia]|uniref:Uncharacterized protein n=1 Tax=Pseudoalteromonas aurantia 208 TaxID=1314867 RepID=A0ABR9EHI0_9GAMM|nr:hypothetical protein [Pseudoalteromonas aurantia]MBE0370461.1 hypothetical protein [Pseudoalteromonas aurantia 208]
MKLVIPALALFGSLFAQTIHASNLKYSTGDVKPTSTQSVSTSSITWDSPSCRRATANIGTGSHNIIPMVLMNSNGECLISPNGAPREAYEQFANQINPQIDKLEHNFKEMITQFVNNAAAQADANVKNISAELDGPMKMSINGVVDADGFVPVTFSNFNIHGVGKLRKYQLGLRIHIYIHIKYNNMVVKGKYNVFTNELIPEHNISSFQPEVYSDVDLPWLFAIIDAITPAIFEKLNIEFNRVVTDIFEFFGVDMSQDIPKAVQHVADIIPSTIIPIKALEDSRVGERVSYTISVDRTFAALSDGQNTTTMQLVPVFF